MLPLPDPFESWWFQVRRENYETRSLQRTRAKWGCCFCPLLSCFCYGMLAKDRSPCLQEVTAFAATNLSTEAVIISPWLWEQQEERGLCSDQIAVLKSDSWPGTNHLAIWVILANEGSPLGSPILSHDCVGSDESLHCSRCSDQCRALHLASVPVAFLGFIAVWKRMWSESLRGWRELNPVHSAVIRALFYICIHI